MTFRTVALTLAALAPTAAAHGQAITNPSGALDIRLVIEEACEVSWPGGGSGAGSATLDFGTAANIDQPILADIGTGPTGGIEIRCNAGATYHVEFDDGQNGGGNVDNRAMRGTTNSETLIPYQLYGDSGRTQILSRVSRQANGALQPLPIYGRVAPLSPTPPADTYVDTVMIQISL